MDAEGRVELLPIHGSADLTALTRSDGLASIKKGTFGLPRGGRVDFHPVALRWP
jgi:molybdopterin biosynthesis enzyme